jgi:ketosteroid isomerase-like protein
MTGTELDTVHAWHAALNAGDVDGLLVLSTQDVEVGGPRGAGRGAHLLKDWVARAGMRMQPVRLYRRGHSIVVEESAQWRAPDGQLTDPQPVACAFDIRDGQVASIVRYADVASALVAAGLEESDEAV